MATPTLLHHPKRNTGTTRLNRFPYGAKVRREGATMSDLITSLRAAYEPANGGAPQPFQGEAQSLDRVKLVGWHPTIKPKDQLVLSHPDGVTTLFFYINDRSPGDSSEGLTTMLTVSPWKGGR